jgi:transposase-like protein
MCSTSKNKLKRKLSTTTRKKIVEYWLLGIKTKKQIRQQYGVDAKTLQQLNRWYRKLKEPPYSSSRVSSKKTPKIITNMRSEKKAMQERIKALEKENAALKKHLEWVELKSFTFETMIKVAEEELEVPLRKKYGAEPFKK